MQIIPASNSPFLSFGAVGTSQQPADGLLFNAPNISVNALQRVEFPIIASSTGMTVAFWMRKNISFADETATNGGSPFYQWLMTTRPETETYFTTADCLPTQRPYHVNGTPRTGSLGAEATGNGFNRIVIFIPGTINAGKLTMFSSPAATQEMKNANLADVMIYTGAWTAAQLADINAGHATNLIHRYTMAAGTTGNSVPDSLGNGAGVLINF